MFPLFEKTTGIFGGPTEITRYEHDEIREALAKMRSALDHADTKAFQRAWEELRAIQPTHDRKEERLLYPAIDRAIPAAEREDVMRRMR